MSMTREEQVAYLADTQARLLDIQLSLCLSAAIKAARKPGKFINAFNGSHIAYRQGRVIVCIKRPGRYLLLFERGVLGSLYAVDQEVKSIKDAQAVIDNIPDLRELPAARGTKRRK